MDQIRQTIVQIWDRRVFYRHMEMGESITLIAQSLPVIERIGEMEKNGSLGKEQAEILRRQMLAGTTKFLNAGITIPELASAGSHDPRMLMKPSPKLLVSHHGTLEGATESSEGSTEQSTDEPKQQTTATSADAPAPKMSKSEIAALRELLTKAEALEAPQPRPKKRSRKPKASSQKKR